MSATTRRIPALQQLILLVCAYTLQDSDTHTRERTHAPSHAHMQAHTPRDSHAQKY